MKLIKTNEVLNLCGNHPLSEARVIDAMARLNDSVRGFIVCSPAKSRTADLIVECMNSNTSLMGFIADCDESLMHCEWYVITTQGIAHSFGDESVKKIDNTNSK